MPSTFRLTLAQLNPVVGETDSNAEKARFAYAEAKAAGANMLVLPEMFITGYQVQDLIMRPSFHRYAQGAIAELAASTKDGPALGIGGPAFDETGLYNAFYVLRGGKIATVVKKRELPNFKVFDEKRHYAKGPLQGPYSIGNVRIGTPICEDAWHSEVPEALAESGADFLVVPNGSPYFRDKFERRIAKMTARVVETGLPLAYLNLVGGQDDQVFDGGSFVLNPDGRIAVQFPLFEEHVGHIDFEMTDEGWRALGGDMATFPNAWEQDYRVMVEGLRDYMSKTGFSKVVLGLSGGVDSALVATIAADALGPENVRCVMLPSEYTSQGSLDDAAACAKALGTRLDTVSIAAPRAAFTENLAPLFEGQSEDVTEENLQSRIRGTTLMAISNKFGEMLLTTGNKSEVAVGYATIYGDMNGGYNPIKDLYKMRVFETCRWRNANHRHWMNGPAGQVIPVSIIEKPPSAELREDQKDEDSLPPYEVLDAILEHLVDHETPVSDVIAEGFDADIVRKVEHLIYISEYKRFQSAPGPRLTPRSFWLDRRYPIVNRWRDR
ncbi:MAG: NAD+ synthase [Pseudomonadota bacterium]